MQGHQRKFGQSPSQDNLQQLAGYNNINSNSSGQVYFQNQNSTNGVVNNGLLQPQQQQFPSQRMQTPPPPNTYNKMVTTIQGTGVNMINKQFTAAPMKLPASGGNQMISMPQNPSQLSTSASTSLNLSIKSGVDANKRLKGENEALQERLRDLERRGKESQFNYAKEHIDVASYIVNNYSKYGGLLSELNEVKLQYLEESRKNRQVRDINEQLKQKQRNSTMSGLNPQEQQEQNKQFELNRQIQQMQRDNQALAAQYKQAENEILMKKQNQNPLDKGFVSQQEKDNLEGRLGQLQDNIHKRTEQLEEQEKRKNDLNLNQNKKNFFTEYDQMTKQVALLRQSNQDLNESLKEKIIEIHKLQGKEPPNFQQEQFSKQFQK